MTSVPRFTSPQSAYLFPPHRRGNATFDSPRRPGLTVGAVERFGFRRSLLSQKDTEHRHRTDRKELALPVLKGLEPETRRSEIRDSRNGRLAGLGILFVVQRGARAGVQQERQQ